MNPLLSTRTALTHVTCMVYDSNFDNRDVNEATRFEETHDSSIVLIHSNAIPRHINFVAAQHGFGSARLGEDN